MASVFGLAARRSISYGSYGGLMAVPTLVGVTSYHYYGQTNSTLCCVTNCEANKNKSKALPSNIKTRMTSIGRFSLESETSENPSIPTFFMALVGEKPLTVGEFATLWKQRDMENRHERFHSKLSKDHPGHFEPVHQDVQQHVSETLFPLVYRQELKHRIQTMLLTEFPLREKLWQMEFMNGPLGASGAISKAKAQAILKRHGNYQESLLLFRHHHALADGVSIMAAMMDLTDEAEEIRDTIVQEMQKKRGGKNKTLLQKLFKRLQILLWLWWGSIRAVLYQIHLFWTTTRNPFDFVKQLQPTNIIGRSISWCDAAPIDQVKEIAKVFGSKVTVNDVIVACTSYAVAKQLEQHQLRLEDVINADKDTREQQSVLANEVNVAIPVHLGGGVLLPGQSIGNNIGALVARVPCVMHSNTQDLGAASTMTPATDRLIQVHKELYKIKNTPAPLLSHYMAKFCSWCLPSSWTQALFAKANAGASFVVSNTGRGPAKKLHLGGRTIESAGAFLPLPPGIPLGIVANSYAGTLQLSVTAEVWAVPDADKFLGWFLEEYQRLCQEADYRKKSSFEN